PGDVVAIYANNDKARNELGWNPQYGIDDMMRTAWAWEQRLRDDKELFTKPDAALN
ncbi:MAG: UDP-glucose 4-epimerase GalE, partial [Chitinophagaceae bacterium]